jgi:hypothetical protein
MEATPIPAAPSALRLRSSLLVRAHRVAADTHRFLTEALQKLLEDTRVLVRAVVNFMRKGALKLTQRDDETRLFFVRTILRSSVLLYCLGSSDCTSSFYYGRPDILFESKIASANKDRILRIAKYLVSWSLLSDTDVREVELKLAAAQRVVGATQFVEEIISNCRQAGDVILQIFGAKRLTTDIRIEVDELDSMTGTFESFLSW